MTNNAPKPHAPQYAVYDLKDNRVDDRVFNSDIAAKLHALSIKQNTPLQVKLVKA